MEVQFIIFQCSRGQLGISWGLVSNCLCITYLLHSYIHSSPRQDHGWKVRSEWARRSTPAPQTGGQLAKLLGKKKKKKQIKPRSISVTSIKVCSLYISHLMPVHIVQEADLDVVVPTKTQEPYSQRFLENYFEAFPLAFIIFPILSQRTTSTPSHRYVLFIDYKSCYSY